MCYRSSRITSWKKVCRYFQVTHSGIEKFSMKDLAKISFHFVSLDVLQKFPHHFLEESLPLLSSDIQGIEKFSMKDLAEISFHFVSLDVLQKFPHHFLEESLPLLSSDTQWHRKIVNERFGRNFISFCKPACVTEVPASLPGRKFAVTFK